jgi:lipopolysaccharide biosynthesis glycosyltransferase
LAIAFGIDAPYAPHLGAAIASVVATTPNTDFSFFILHDGVPADVRLQVEACAPLAHYQWIEISEAGLLALEGREHISRATYYRLVLPRVVPKAVSRLMYLDTDLTVVRDLNSLWRVDLAGRPIGAAADVGVDSAAFAKRWSLDPSPRLYFNAGVLLIDLVRVRETGAFERALDFLATHRPDLPWMDQDALNFAFWANWTKLDPIWNVQRNMVIESMPRFAPDAELPRGRRPGIVHFTTAEKPWKPGNYHPYGWLYWRSMARTPFREAVADAAGLTIEQRLRVWARWAVRAPFLAP